jgi:hypothetical protein
VLVVRKTAAVPLQDIHASRERADPHIPVIVPVGRVNGIIADTAVIHVVVQVILKGPCNGIVEAETAVLRADPKGVAGILPQGIYDIARQTVRMAGVVPEMPEVPYGAIVRCACSARRLVHAIETASVRSDPDLPPAVLEDDP